MATAKYKHAASVSTDLANQGIANGNSDDVEKNLEDSLGILFSIKCVYGASAGSGLTVRVVDALESGGDYGSDDAALIAFEMPYAVSATRYVTVPVLLPQAGSQIKLILENNTGDSVTVTVKSRALESVEVL